MVAIPTARGDEIDSGDLGFTMPVETVFVITATEADTNWPDLSFSAVPEEERIADAVAKLTYAKEQGVDTIIDRTLPGIGRDVRRVRKIAEQVPLNILVCTGWYTWHDLPFFFSFSPVEQAQGEGGSSSRPTLEEIMVRDVEVGIGETGVRAAAIKCVTDHYGLTSGVRRAVQSAARAHRRTGAPITTHTGIEHGVASAFLQRQVFEEEGVDLSRVQFGHLDFTPPDVGLDEFKRLFDSGCFGSFDTLNTLTGARPDYAAARVERIVGLIEAGYIDQILLSTDSCCWQDLLPEGTPRPPDADQPPYTHLFRVLLPRLRERGITDEQIDRMTRDNPRRFLETRGLGGY